MTTPLYVDSVRAQISVYMHFTPTSVEIYDAETGEVYARTNLEACEWLKANGSFITSTEPHADHVVLAFLTVDK